MDSRELREQIHHTRSDIDHTIDEIRNATSPREIAEQVMGLMRAGPGEFLGNLGRTVRDNPVPTALTTLGIIWLAGSTSRDEDEGERYELGLEDEDLLPEPERGTYAANVERPGIEALTTPMAGVPHGESDYGERRVHISVHETDEGEGESEGISERVRGKAEQAKHKAREAMEGARAKAGEITERGRSRVSDTGTEARARGRRAMHRARRAGGKASDQFFHQLNDNPLVLAAIGMAVGAAVGGSLPRTRQEDRRLGPLGDKARREVKRVARREGGHLQQAARDIGHEAMSTARRAVHEATREDTDTAQAASRELQTGARNVAETTREHLRESEQRIEGEIERAPSSESSSPAGWSGSGYQNP